MKIFRVFPKRTSFTPDDEMVRIGRPYPELWPLVADEIHISCTFSWDKSYCKELKKEWLEYYPVVKLGGPAYGSNSDEFIPGRYVKKGITFTSRGCNFTCPFCLVPKMEGKFREINIEAGDYKKYDEGSRCS